MAVNIEDAGFEIRDQIMWVYGSGFPKSHNIGKAIDKKLGVEREIVGINPNHRNSDALFELGFQGGKSDGVMTKGTSEYEGWGTALKPAHEPIVMARKPFKGTVVDNVLEHGTGAINIDGCRVGDEEMINPPGFDRWNDFRHGKDKYPTDEKKSTTSIGRWPANFIHDGSEEEWSKYFYCPKANKKDREENNNHPTVKPTDLMKYLIRLVTPKNGTVLDPFMGSGSTGKAAILEGFDFIGIELSEEYLKIAEKRINHAITDNE
jgi:site-specific DNA-methyltransferase (adenine-specific)